ncbi:MAG: Radical SAM domain protein [bacterium 42_11]|nr:MAG: Radical SAM domain protein [bacterium 42_11]
MDNWSLGYSVNLWNARVDIEPKPDLKNVFVEVTNSCNLNCQMCFRNFMIDSMGEMDLRLFEKLLSDLRLFPEVELVYLAGIGEPACHPNFFEMLKMIKERGYSAGFSTNGLSLDDEKLREVVGLGVDVVYFSVDYLPNQEASLGHIMSGEGIETVKKLIKLKDNMGKYVPSVGVEIVVSKENIDTLPQQIRLLVSLGVNSITISNMMPLDDSQVDKVLYNGALKEKTQQILNRLYSLSGRGVYIRIPNFEVKTERKCDFDETCSTVIRWDGEVVPCYRFLHTYDEIILGRRKRVNAFSFGNIREKTLYDIWMDREYTVFRFIMKNYVYPSCTDCHLKESCDFVLTADQDCWANSPSCADCLWARNLILCPVPRKVKNSYV